MNKNRLKGLLLTLLIIIMSLFYMPVRGQLISDGMNARVNLNPEEENLNVLDQWLRWNNPGSFLIAHLNRRATDLYAVRRAEIARLITMENWQERQKMVMAKLIESTGPFPEKTPLNARVTGIIRHDGVRIEKIIFESFPGFYVTGCLYIPEKIKGRAPAVLNVIGHNQESFRAPLYQVVNFNLAKKGIVVFAIDPPGQGEHVQNYDEKVKFSSVGYSVIEHCYFGNQCFLCGYSCARYFIWDGIRAIDYLVSRKDVDPDRIGVTGFSGGGTITAYIAALDQRVKVSIPCSWATANEKLLEMKGAQDAESILYHSLKNGITFEDLLEVRAPKPALLTAVSRDEYLSLQGAREAYSEAGKAYDAFGKGENLRLTEDDSKHWLTPKIRHDIYSFFLHHFDLPGDPAELEAVILSPEELTVTTTGQISTSAGGNMIFDENRKIAEDLLARIEMSRKDRDKHLDQVKRKAAELSGYDFPGRQFSGFIINGKYRRDGYSVGKYAINVNDEYVITVLLFIPDDSTGKLPALIYLNPAGKNADAGPGGKIERIVKEGFVVAAVDPLGTGETKNTAVRGLADGYTAILTGGSTAGIQAGDISTVAELLRRDSRIDTSRIGALGIDGMCIPLLHAAALNRTISNVVLLRPLISYGSVAINRNYRIGFTPREGGGYWHPYELDFTWGVAGALTAYDLPDLIGCIAPGKTALSGVTSEMLEPASDSQTGSELSFPLSVYSSTGAAGNIRVEPVRTDILPLIKWSFQK